MEKSGNFRSIREKSAKVVPENIYFLKIIKNKFLYMFFQNVLHIEKLCVLFVKIVIFELFPY